MVPSAYSRKQHYIGIRWDDAVGENVGENALDQSNVQPLFRYFRYQGDPSTVHSLLVQDQIAWEFAASRGQNM